MDGDVILDFGGDDKDFEDFEVSERLKGVGAKRYSRLTREESLAMYLASSSPYLWSPEPSRRNLARRTRRRDDKRRGHTTCRPPSTARPFLVGPAADGSTPSTGACERCTATL